MQQPTHNDIHKLFGDLGDHTVTKILESGANLEQSEEAAAYLFGETDAISDARIPLVGAAARAYDIVVKVVRLEPPRS